MISPNELTALRSVAVHSLIDSCEIQRFTSVSDGSGGTIDDWATVSTQPCRVAENKQQRSEYVTGGTSQSHGTHVVRLPHGVDVSESDRLVVTISGRTRTFEISRVYESSYATLTSIGCTETRGS